MKKRRDKTADAMTASTFHRLYPLFFRVIFFFLLFYFFFSLHKTHLRNVRCRRRVGFKNNSVNCIEASRGNAVGGNISERWGNTTYRWSPILLLDYDVMM